MDFIRAAHDTDARVWVATSDVPGLMTELPSAEALDVKLRTLVPELFEVSGWMPPVGTMPVELRR